MASSRGALQSDVWCIVVADGERRHEAEPVEAAPLQFRAAEPPVTLLQRSLHRAAALAGRSRTFVVVSEQHELHWRGPLWAVPDARRVIDAGASRSVLGVCAALLSIVGRAPAARVVILPAETHVEAEVRWRDAVDAALHVCHHGDLYECTFPADGRHALDDVLRVGRPDGRPGLPVRSVVRRPSKRMLATLATEGACVRSGVLVGFAGMLLDALQRRHPHWVRWVELTAVRAVPATAPRRLALDLCVEGSRLEPRPAGARAPELRAIVGRDCGWRSPSTLLERSSCRDRRAGGDRTRDGGVDARQWTHA